MCKNEHIDEDVYHRNIKNCSSKHFFWQKHSILMWNSERIALLLIIIYLCINLNKCISIWFAFSRIIKKQLYVFLK